MQSKERELTSACAVYGEVKIIISCLLEFRKQWAREHKEFAEEYGWCLTKEENNLSKFYSGVRLYDIQGVVTKSIKFEPIAHRRYINIDTEFFSLSQLDHLIDRYRQSLRRITEEINSLTASIMEEFNDVS